jgi:hypothetical protein
MEEAMEALVVLVTAATVVVSALTVLAPMVVVSVDTADLAVTEQDWVEDLREFMEEPTSVSHLF